MSCFMLESVFTALEKHSCACILLSPDDITKSRGTEEISARDNAIFELGLFMGRHGRRSAFIAIPEMPKVRLPTDVWGLVAVTYRVKGETYDVTDAVREIIDALETAPIRTGRRAYERPSMFWDVMRADTILILYGVEPEIDPKTHAHPRVSLRDLETSLELKTFLDRRYPAKRVLLVPASSLGWERRYPNADLVIVGGFITNAEFAQHRTRYENLVRLRMGRLCIVMVSVCIFLNLTFLATRRCRIAAMRRQ